MERRAEMKLTKEDYMKLSKERLAELLVEMDSHPIEPITIPTIPTTSPRGWCDGSVCTNPFRDCINCPGYINTRETMTTFNTALKAEEKE